MLANQVAAPALFIYAEGAFNIGDEVIITAIVRRRVTEDRISVSILSYNQPQPIVDRTSKITKGQPIELVGGVTYLDEGKATVSLGPYHR